MDVRTTGNRFQAIEERESSDNLLPGPGTPVTVSETIKRLHSQRSSSSDTDTPSKKKHLGDNDNTGEINMSNTDKQDKERQSATSEVAISAELVMPEMPKDNASHIEWFKYICTQIASVRNTVTDLLATVEAVNKKADNAMALAVDTTNKLQETSNDIHDLQLENVMLNKKVKLIEEKLLRSECYQRRDNLIFDGIPEEKGEKDFQCYRKVVSVLQYVEEIGEYAQTIRISRCHRLGPYVRGRTRGIICHIHWYGDRSLILRNRLNLPDRVSVREDYPPEIEYRRKQLYPILIAAKKSDKYRNRCKLVADKLVLDSKVYTAGPEGNLDNLPDGLNPVQVSQMQNDSCLLFFGRNHPFSSFYDCQFKINDTNYCCTEQYVQSEKCKLFKDDTTLYKIMNSTNAYEMKNFGSKVKHYNAAKWATECPKAAFSATLAKFSQNDKLKCSLVSTGDLSLGEATRDKFWGVGQSLWEKPLKTHDMWQGENLMGKTLMKVRERLS